MNNTTTKKHPHTPNNSHLRAEYDFSQMIGGVKGKYHKAYRAGHAVKIHQDDGTTIVQHFKLEDGAMIIEPDVREYFPTEEVVNKTLQSLIELLPKKRRTKEKV